jgi:hypothetical protein
LTTPIAATSHIPPIGFRSGNENVTAFIAWYVACYLLSINAIYATPCPGAVILEFNKLLHCGHTPLSAPFYASHIVFRIKNAFMIIFIVFGKPGFSTRILRNLIPSNKEPVIFSTK